MLVTASREKGVLEEEEQAMLHKVFEFADKDAADVMVPRPDVVARAGRAAGGGDAAARALPPVHPLSGLRRASSTTSSACCTCATCSRRCTTAACERRRRALDPARRRSSCPRRSRSTSSWPSSSAPRTTWRSWSTSTARSRASSRSRTCSRRSWARSATSSTCPRRASVRIGRGRVRLGGSFPIEEFNERFGTHLPDDDYHTVGGFVFGELGRAPKVGDSVELRRRPVRGERDRRAAHRRGGRDALGRHHGAARPPATGRGAGARARPRARRSAGPSRRRDSVMPPALWLTQRA